MKRVMMLLAGFGLLGLAGGCGDLKTDTPESVMQEMTSLLSQTSEELGKVQDEKGATDIPPKLKTAWERWQALEGRLAAAKAAQRRAPSTQSTKTVELQLGISKKLFGTQWKRLYKLNKPWADVLIEEFKEFILAVTGMANEPEREILPPTIDTVPLTPPELNRGVLEKRDRLR